LRKRYLFGLGILLGGLGLVIKTYLPETEPQAILVLGGHEARERLAAQIARRHPQLPVWVSSGSPENYVKKIFLQAGVRSDRLHLDYRASDTVTNFTTLADDLKQQGIHRVYLVTSTDHMRRAYVVGEIVFGSRGIALEPVLVNSPTPAETWYKSFRDGARAVVWVLTGYAGNR
jgi:uncharacterized SAM-binding protein YcdF (DUF218 family)